MDQIKIGRFIAERRRQANLTQAQLAEKLNITDRAVSKWETGKSMPDSSIMLKLCEILDITVNDLLCGEIMTTDSYKKQLEKTTLQMVIQKEQADKRLLMLEIVIGVLSMTVLLGFSFIASFVNMEAWLRVLLVVSGFAIGMAGCAFGIMIEQTAGYYECAKCGHRYVPTYSSVFFAMHSGRTRYMKCPKCHKMSWQKKRISRDE